MAFKRSMRGYDIEEVDRVVSDLKAQNRRLADVERDLEGQADHLRKKLAGYTQQLNMYHDNDRNLRDALAGVQRIEAQIRKDAEREVAEIIEKARAEARALVEKSRIESEETLNRSSEVLMKTTAEVNDMMAKTQEKIQKMEEEAEEMLARREVEIKEALQAVEAETKLKQESLDQLTTLVESYQGRLSELRMHVNAIERLLSERK